jgi:solute carrier family 8 (sodium/calcium exchanger)
MFGPTMDENENMIEVTCWEALIHFVSMPWKLLFAFIPPRKLYGGWLSFIICFIMIGIVSMFLLSVISAMGCVFNIMPCIQAILMVSIGTSLPDFYASKALALDKNVTYADAAIGNVFGANAANVFIGLGIPWTIASIYYEYFEGEYYSIGFNETADITFCIVMFFILSFIVFMILFIRTTKESVLGGKVKCKTFSGLLMIILWGLFALFTILGCYEVIPSR